MMNAETSALGRCLALMGIGTKRSMASASDVRNRQAERSVQEHPTNHRPQRPSAPKAGSAAFPEDDYVPPGEPAPVINMNERTRLTSASAAQVQTIQRMLEQQKVGLYDIAEQVIGKGVTSVDDLSKGDASKVIKYLIERKEG
jgi:hypothetical protein